MKTNIKFVLMATVLLMISCGQTKQDCQKDNETKKESVTTKKDVKSEVQDVVEVSKEYASHSIDELNAEVKAMRNSVNQEMNKIEKEYDALADEVQERYKKQRADLKKQQKELESKIDEYEQAAEDERAELVAEADQLRTSLNKSIETFKKEMDKETK